MPQNLPFSKEDRRTGDKERRFSERHTSYQYVHVCTRTYLLYLRREAPHNLKYQRVPGTGTTYCTSSLYYRVGAVRVRVWSHGNTPPFEIIGTPSNYQVPRTYILLSARYSTCTVYEYDHYVGNTPLTKLAQKSNNQQNNHLPIVCVLITHTTTL